MWASFKKWAPLIRLRLLPKQGAVTMHFNFAFRYIPMLNFLHVIKDIVLLLYPFLVLFSCYFVLAMT